jgi:uncharacterized protein YfkK (UPF0435 family)
MDSDMVTDRVIDRDTGAMDTINELMTILTMIRKKSESYCIIISSAKKMIA